MAAHEERLNKTQKKGEIRDGADYRMEYGLTEQKAVREITREDIYGLTVDIFRRKTFELLKLFFLRVDQVENPGRDIGDGVIR
jgi:hypothetical protein